jgi:diguanylate cyclase (GGDEF)-like protein
MLDIDDFKHFNDTYGHQQGDKILQDIAAFLRDTSRNLDLCARYGGEEFAIMLPETTTRKAVSLAERLRKQIEQQIHSPAPITVSMGVASCPEHAQDVKDLVRKADRAVYHSKNVGKIESVFHL